MSDIGPGPHPGTGLWRTWSQYDAANVRDTAEFSLYSDTWFTNVIRDHTWPLDVMPTMPDWGVGGMKFAAVARVRWSPDPSFDPSEVKLTTDSRAYHGGDTGDEVAALVSLALGVRCRSGGITRRWLIDDGQHLDPLGMPIEADHRPPTWEAPSRGRTILPTLSTEADFGTAVSLFRTFSTASAETASVLVRAARLYSNSLWIADSDPNQAWLLLVSAVETVAVYMSGTKPIWRRTQEALPRVWEKLVAAGGEKHAEDVGELLAPMVQSTDRFLNLLEAHLPTPPVRRPAEFAQLDWSDLRPRFRKIYNYRSRALHDGTPFPEPMCDPPMKSGTDIPSEKPEWLSSSTGLATWAADDVPMFLHTFEYVVRGTLLSWWASSFQ